MKNQTNNKTVKNQGSILVNRKIMNWQHYGQPSCFSVFLTLLLVANHEERWWKGIKVGRGETVISVKSLAKICGLSEPTVYKALKGLIKSGEIERRRTILFHCITKIVKYDEYQADSKALSKKSLHLPLDKQYNISNSTNIIPLPNNNIYIKGDFEILNEMLQSGIVVEQFCKNEGITVEQFEELAREVIFDWKLTDTTHVSEQDMKRHLLSTIRIIKDKRNLVSNDLDSRLAPFIATCKSLIEQGSPSGDVREFYRYWTQPCNDRSGRLLFESVKAWDAETKFLDYFKNRK